MEIVLCITLLLVVSKPFLRELSKLLYNLTNFVKQLHTEKPQGVLGDGKTITFSLTVDSRDKKRNSCRKHKSHKKRLD